MERKDWFKQGIEGGAGGSLCCGGTSAILDVNTVLYNGYGGWSIQKNGSLFYCGEIDTDWEKEKSIADIDEEIDPSTYPHLSDPNDEYVAIFDSPLRSAKYQRHQKGNWVLIEKGEGFA